MDFYVVLGIGKAASLTEIKAAYHRALLQAHPDTTKTHACTVNPLIEDISLIKEAYATLASPALRSDHDARLQSQMVSTKIANTGPRPAQVVSLEEFEEEDVGEIWSYSCRCGGVYQIKVEQMEEGKHLVGCNSCSEVVWVGYELEDEVGGELDDITSRGDPPQ